MILKYREWIAEHPVTMGTTRILAGDEEFIRQDGKIFSERNIFTDWITTENCIIILPIDSVPEKTLAVEIDERVHDDKENQVHQVPREIRNILKKYELFYITI